MPPPQGLGIGVCPYVEAPKECSAISRTRHSEEPRVAATRLRKVRSSMVPLVLGVRVAQSFLPQAPRTIIVRRQEGPRFALGEPAAAPYRCTHTQRSLNGTPIMRRRLALKNWTLLVASATLLWGCASGPKPTPVDIQLTGAATVNPDSRNRPSPVMVRVYELKTPAAFESADFFSLFDKDRETLAADMNTRDEFVLQPGQTVSLKRDAKMDTRYIGVLVAYRDLERSRWRAVTALPSGKSQVVKITAGPRAVEITASPK